MSTYQMVYRGTRKISAIKAVRKVCGIGLKEAKDACENRSGFTVYGSSVSAILAEYMASRGNSDHDENLYDWAVGTYEASEPIDLRGMSPHMDTVMAGCREIGA